MFTLAIQERELEEFKYEPIFRASVENVDAETEARVKVNTIPYPPLFFYWTPDLGIHILEFIFIFIHILGTHPKSKPRRTSDNCNAFA